MKKTFSKFLATAAAVSMLASVATVVNADGVEFTTTPVEGGVVITGVTGYDENTTEITIPETIGEATVVGVQDYAFVTVDNLAVIKTPATLVKDNVGTVAFMTKNSLVDYINDVVGADAEEADYLEYIAKTISYAGKTEGWTEEELAEVKTKLEAKAKLAGVPEGAEVEDAVAIMLQNKAAMNLTANTTDKVAIWEATVTYDEVTVEIPEGSGIADLVLPKRGDANADGVVNVRDAAAIAAALAKNDISTIAFTSDYNADGVINVRDAAAIASALAKA